jgi:hypothetical protein
MPILILVATRGFGYREEGARLKGTSMNCLRALRDLKRAAARRNSQGRLVALCKDCTGFCSCKTGILAILGNKRSTTAWMQELGQRRSSCRDACFRPRPAGLFGWPSLRVVISRRATSMPLKSRLDSGPAGKPEITSNS